MTEQERRLVEKYAANTSLRLSRCAESTRLNHVVLAVALLILAVAN